MKISGKFSRKSNRDAGGDVTGRQPERLRNTKGSKGRRAEKEERKKEIKQFETANRLMGMHQVEIFYCCVISEYLSVIVSKDRAKSTDRGRPISFKFSSFFPYQIRLKAVVCLVKENKLLTISSTPLVLFSVQG